ncbi:MAG: hypothetical protein JSU66_10255 [Deltaproteobacteria bacterium]|nr:MAG: hypothetical protein JSU66_10255 [Deltaproteobacteria bacterium]
MDFAESSQLGTARSRGDPFIVYVEGPSDREILRGWAGRVSPALGRALDRAARILGGRQPERAAAHFRGLGGASRTARGLCVLDRDGEADSAPPSVDESGLEFFTWSRRHIESYLLVPDAIRRGLRLPGHDQRVARFFEAHLPRSPDESAFQKLDAKRLLGREGALARALGRPVTLGRVARAMQVSEFHPDVQSLIERLRAGFGVL